MSRRATRPDAPLDVVLERLRGLSLCYRWSYSELTLWEAVCPSCRTPELGLLIRERYRGADVELRCLAGCEPDLISWALSVDPAEQRVAEALDLAEASHDIAARAVELAARNVAA
jgi:hypothetical protein